MKTSLMFAAAFLVGGALGVLVAEQAPDFNSLSRTITVIPSAILSGWHYLLNPHLLFEFVESQFRLRAFLLGGFTGCVILLLAPILFGSGKAPSSSSKATQKFDY